MKYTLAIIGTGRIAGLFDKPRSKDGVFTHAKACLKSGSISLLAACDINKTKLKKFCKTWQVKNAYSELKELLHRHKVDIITLAAPAQTHFSLIKMILRHKNSPRILFVEKPVCLKKQELTEIKKILPKTGTQLIVNHTYRFNLRLKKAVSLINKRKLGRILFFRAVYYGGLFNNGVHIVDILRMIFGSRLKVVDAQIGSSAGLNDPCVNALLFSGLNPQAEIILESMDGKYYQLYEIEIRLEKGRVRIMDFAKDIYIDKVLTNKAGERELKTAFKIANLKNNFALTDIYKRIVRYLATGRKSALTGLSITDAAKTMEMLWKIKQKTKK